MQAIVMLNYLSAMRIPVEDPHSGQLLLLGGNNNETVGIILCAGIAANVVCTWDRYEQLV